MSKGITREKIIEETEELIAECGISAFSLHALAERLGIKTASLYTHVSGIDEVLAAASEDILRKFHDGQMKSIEGKRRQDALAALAESERSFAKENASFYELIMNLQLSGNQELKDAAACIVEPLMKILSEYRLDEDEKTDAERLFRAVVYGFISQEKHGYFSHFSGSTEDSFRFAVSVISSGIEAMEHEE